MYAKDCYLKILTYEQVKDFVVIHFHEHFNPIEKMILLLTR